MSELILAKSAEAYKAAVELFKEYAVHIEIDLGFQHFDDELASLKSMYAFPSGGIILYKADNEFIACVGVRKIDTTTAELKRMFVKPLHQHKGIGNLLMTHSIKLARQCGYSVIRLDTLSYMKTAINLYKKYGFQEIAPYYFNPNADAKFFELRIGL